MQSEEITELREIVKKQAFVKNEPQGAISRRICSTSISRILSAAWAKLENSR